MAMWRLSLGFLILNSMVDVTYFVRVLSTFVIAKYFKKKISVLDSSTVYGIVLPTDADLFITHMNNSRYLREFDFARFDHATRMGAMDELIKHRGTFIVLASTIRYRRPTMMFSSYKIVTRLAYWDSKFIYVEQKMITLQDGIIRSVGYSKNAGIKFDGIETLKKLCPNVEPPEIPNDLKKWIESCEISSEMMKNPSKLIY